MSKKNIANKDIKLEIIRIIACFFVVFMHTGEDGFLLYLNYNINDIKYWIYISISIFSRISIPLFFMISGIFILKKDLNVRYISKKILNIIIIIVFFSFIYYLKDIVLNEEKLNLKLFFIKIYSNMYINSYWFLYMYIIFLLISPVLKQISKNQYLIKYLFIIYLFYQTIKIIEFLISKGEIKLNPYLNISLFNDYIFIYPLVGYYLYNNNFSIKKIKILWIINICLIIISSLLWTYKYKIGNSDVSYNFFESFVIINSTAVFLSINNINVKNMGDNLKKLILNIGSSTLYIYLIHEILLSKKLFIYKVFLYIKNINDMLGIIIYCFTVMIISCIIVSIIKIIIKYFYIKIKRQKEKNF